MMRAGATRTPLSRAPVVSRQTRGRRRSSMLGRSSDTDTVKLMQSVALYNEEVTGPEHALSATAPAGWRFRNAASPT